MTVLSGGSDMARMACALCLLSMALPALSEPLRDPTLPPSSAGFCLPEDAPKPVALSTGSYAVVVRSGRPFLIVDARLYAKGQTVGQERIERISETEVWLRGDGVLRKIPLFSGVERHSRRTAVTNQPSRTVLKAVSAKP